MVKFGKHLDSHLVPEWRPAFCNYRKLKKDLKRIKTAKAAEYRTFDGDGGCTALLRGPSLQTIQARLRDEVILVHKSSSELYGSQVDLVETELLFNATKAESEKHFFGRLDAELNKVNQFYKTKEKEFLQHAEILDKQMEALFELKLVAEYRNAYRTTSQSLGSEDEHLFTPLRDENSIDMMDSVVSLHNEMLFQTITNKNTLAKSGLPDKDQLSSIRAQLGDIDIRSTSGAIQGPQSPREFMSALSRSLSEDVLQRVRKSTREPKRNSAEFRAFKAKVQHSEKMLCEAFVEFYRGLGLLKSYSALNMLAFRKIMKKYDKVTERGAFPTYMRTVDESYFHTSDKVANLIIWVEAMYTEYFANGDRYMARKALKYTQVKAPHRVTFFLGLFSGCSLMLAVAFAAVVHVLYANMTDSERESRTASYLKSVFPIFSMVALLLLHMFMYGWNLYLWRRTRINYAFIFEYAPGTELCYRKVLLLCTGLTVVLGGGMLGHLASHYSHSLLIDLIPLGVVLTFLCVLFCPFQIFYLSGRKFFLNCMLRIICSPFYEVRLADFFLGDQLCSQVPMLRNLEYTICYYGGGHFKTENADACLNNPVFQEISYMIAVLPYWWRLMQCLRRYRDEKNKAHLANGGKYLSAMIVVLIRTQYGKNETTMWMILYIIASTFATCYQIYWDLVIDWGLLRSNSVHPWLRKQLVLEDRKFFYFFSMGLNVVLRFPWLLSITHYQFGGLDSHITDFLLAAIEVFRRGHWNFYRLENEHLNNVGHYRAIKTVPLPFVR